ncbi:uncharacterized protein LOC126316818 isoform X2 [Schistocerca gregaria]|uniref:uncharacterized protein LOC126316818 isoform X2 n=1 Tax=Schistocerca gregaria TaxID=7010 RepID=UPI00211E3BF9|nr:uncharacterized protein LOC126316818 isoform X2 [Schistocerca gregaria]XP_049848869.1 uncharacterized protein LOC126316818 isoform X2 [Schistocerca gregaria]
MVFQQHGAFNIFLPFTHPTYHICSTPFIHHANEAAITRLTEEITELYDIDIHRLELIRMAIQQEMEAGLLSNSASSLKMLPSYINRLPLNDISTTAYALDIGGTNLRILKVVLEQGGIIQNIFTNKYSIPHELMVGKGEDLINFIAQCLLESIDSEDKDAPLGFTFSFPIRQTSIKKGYLIEWTKGFSASGIVNEDIAGLLEEELEKLNFPIKVVALVNDTIGTLMTGTFQAHDENCIIGLIIGTGSNACYLEDIELLEKWVDEVPNPPNMIINVELGGFDSPTYTHLLPTKFDLMLDNNSVNIGCQHFEKMISGMYLGELVRLTLKNYQDLFEIFSDNSVNALDRPYQLQTQLLSQMQQDDSPELHYVGDVLNKLGITCPSLAIRQFAKHICCVISRRSARLAAAGVAAIVEHKKRGNIFSIVAVDGTIFEVYPGYRSIVEETIKELGYPNVQLRLVKDGSGNGAAIAASTMIKST